MDEKVKIPINVIYNERINENGMYKKWLASRPQEYFEYRENWTQYPQRGYTGDYPLNLDIEPTNICNLRCPFCYRTIALEKHVETIDWHGVMSLDTYKKILSQIIVNGKTMVPAIKLTHRGEPLINQNISEFVRLAKIGGGVYDVMINTNGSMLSESLVNDLLDAHLDKLLFSFDSPYKDRYEAIRKGASYDSVLENIKMFVKMRNDKRDTGTLIRVGMVCTEDTQQKEMDDFYNLFCKIGADVISYNSVHAEVDVDSEGYFTYRGKRRNVKEISFADSQLWQRMTINWNGDAEICCENYKQEWPLGNINEKSVHEIWTGEAFQKVRNSHKNGEWWKIGQCRKCTLPYMKGDS